MLLYASREAYKVKMGLLRLGLGFIPLLLGSHVSANGPENAQIVMGGNEGGDSCFNAVSLS